MNLNFYMNTSFPGLLLAPGRSERTPGTKFHSFQKEGSSKCQAYHQAIPFRLDRYHQVVYFQKNRCPL